MSVHANPSTLPPIKTSGILMAALFIFSLKNSEILTPGRKRAELGDSIDYRSLSVYHFTITIIGFQTADSNR